MKLQRHILITLICLIYPAFGLFSQENNKV